MEMIWCEDCKTVIWAYDHQKPTDLRDIANMWRLACPNCGMTRCFDGWYAKELDETLIRNLENVSREKVFDCWSAMKAVAKFHNVTWDPSPDNTWTGKYNKFNK